MNKEVRIDEYHFSEVSNQSLNDLTKQIQDEKDLDNSRSKRIDEMLNQYESQETKLPESPIMKNDQEKFLGYYSKDDLSSDLNNNNITKFTKNDKNILMKEYIDDEIMMASRSQNFDSLRESEEGKNLGDKLIKVSNESDTLLKSKNSKEKIDNISNSSISESPIFTKNRKSLGNDIANRNLDANGIPIEANTPIGKTVERKVLTINFYKECQTELKNEIQLYRKRQMSPVSTVFDRLFANAMEKNATMKLQRSLQLTPKSNKSKSDVSKCINVN